MRVGQHGIPGHVVKLCVRPNVHTSAAEPKASGKQSLPHLLRFALSASISLTRLLCLQILPKLQAMKPATFVKTVSGRCCDYFDDVSRLDGFSTPNTESLADLVGHPILCFFMND